MNREQIEARIAELEAENEATGWGAAVGVRQEEIEGLKRQLPCSADIVEAVTDELLAHGEFSSGANNRSNAREAARVVVDMVRTFDDAQPATDPAAWLINWKDADEPEQRVFNTEWQKDDCVERLQQDELVSDVEVIPLGPLSRSSAGNVDAIGAAQFLLDRLDEFDPGDDEPEREYHGHVAPAIARLRSALTEAQPQEVQVTEALIAEYADRCFDPRFGSEGASYPTVRQAMIDLALSLSRPNPKSAS